MKPMGAQTSKYHSNIFSDGPLEMEKSLESYFLAFRENIIGHNQTFQTPFGKKDLIYADWTASGRAYQPIEDFIREQVLPFVGNTHTETTVTGALMGNAYEEAKAIIKGHVKANKNDVLIFCGNGMTGAVNKLQRILGIRIPERITDYAKEGSSLVEIDERLRPIVFVTHMEHHSNQVSWLETIATVKIINADKNGNVDLIHFESLLQQYKYAKNKIAAITACSNVTGIETPYHEIAEIIHLHGGLCFVDFACSAPYVDIDMHPVNNDMQLDAIYFSPHKFLGGPGTPGVLIFSEAIYRNAIPDHPGGGTVTYSNPWSERYYVDNIEQREDGGTPPFLQGIKAAMCIKLKEAMGADKMRRREEELLAIIFKRLGQIKNIKILQGDVKQRLGVIAFIVNGAHHNLFVKILNDRFGIQTRGGCSCAGTYGHMLLNVDANHSHYILNAIWKGDLLSKPGWVRLSIHPTMSDAEICFIMNAIEQTAKHIDEWKKYYYYNATIGGYFFEGMEKSEHIAKAWFNAANW